MNLTAKENKAFIQQFTRDKIPGKRTNYGFSIADFYNLYNWYSPEKVNRKHYNYLIKKYLEGHGQVWMDSPEFDLVPYNRIGRFGIRRYMKKNYCSLHNPEDAMSKDINVLRMVYQSKTVGEKMAWKIVWFKKFPSGWFVNQDIYGFKPCRLYYRILVNKLKQAKMLNETYQVKYGLNA